MKLEIKKECVRWSKACSSARTIDLFVQCVFAGEIALQDLKLLLRRRAIVDTFYSLDV